VPIAVTNRWSVPPGDRSTLVPGTYKPGPSNTGVLPGVVRTVASGNVTLSTPGQVYENVTVNGRISVKAANVTIRNVLVNGQGQTPAAGLINCANAAVSNCIIEDVTIAPNTPHWTWNGIVGHDFTVRRSDISGTTDGIEVYNTSAAQPYASGCVIEANWIHDLVWWTAATSGVVHTTDTETHNDGIQHLGGTGTRIVGNFIDAAFSRQRGHWITTTLTEPYSSVALHSLPDGGPYQGIPDRGDGNEANGRYNWDDDACLMIGANYGYTAAMVVEDNWFYGGNFSVNAGGNPYPGSGVNLGSFKRNRFDRKQGSQGAGGNNTYTLALLGNWAGHCDIPLTGSDANVYENDGAYITVRT